MSDVLQGNVLERLREIDHWLTVNARTHIPDETCTIVWKVDHSNRFFKRVGVMLYRHTSNVELGWATRNWMLDTPISVAPLEMRDKAAFQSLLRAIRKAFPDCEANLFSHSWEKAFTQRYLYTNVTPRAQRKEKKT